MKERDIQAALFRAFRTHPYKFTNTYFFKNESDWLSFSSTGYAYDIEVKVSRSDFLADFKKPRHELMKAAIQGKPLALIKGEVQPWVTFFRYQHQHILLRQIRANDGRAVIRTIGRREQTAKTNISFMKTQKVGNRFFFAVPEGLVTPEEVPEYSGLIYVNELGTASKVKDAPLIHKHKHDVKKHFNMVYNHYEGLLRRSLFN